MKTFIPYDIFRLTNYKKENNLIDFGETDSLIYYCFNEVDYFNYIILISEFQNIDELRNVLSIYSRFNRKRIKFLFKESLTIKYDYLIDSEKGFHKIQCVEKIISDRIDNYSDKKVLRPVKTDEEIILYTKLYLKGFKSNKTNIIEVAKNFRLLFDTKSVDLFFIMNNAIIAGICSNFYNGKNVFLCACVVLDLYQNIGLQKKAINERIKFGLIKGFLQFNSWAYDDSVSYHNLIKSGFSKYATYEEYVSKPLENLI